MAPSHDLAGQLADRLTYSGYRTASLIARMMPGPIAQPAVSMIGSSLAVGMRSKRSMIERHLRRVDPTLRRSELRRLSNAAFDSYARYYVESFRLPTLSRDVVEAGFAHDGYLEHAVPALEQGTGVIMALPHLGGWEWAGRWATDHGVEVTVVVEAIQPPELFEWFRDLRETLGMHVVPLGPEAGPAVGRALRNNHIVCLLCDRAIGGGGVEVEFFGERTHLPAGPVTLALRTGAPVVPSAIYFTDRPNGHQAVVRPPLDMERQGSLRDDVARITQVLAHELEGLIRRAPEQWHLFQPNWPSDPGYGGEPG